MIQLTIGTTTNRKTVIVDENTTIRDALQLVTFPMGDTLRLNGESVHDLGATIASFNVGERAALLAVTKADNA